MKKRILATALSLVVLLAFSAVAFADTIPAGWNVTFTSENELESDYNAAAGMGKVFEMQPGDTVELQLNLSNQNGKPSNWYLSNTVLKSLEDADKQNTGGAYEYSLIYTNQAGDETVLYASDTVGGLDPSRAAGNRVGLMNATEGLEDFVFLDTLDANAKGIVRLRVHLDGETQGNTYQATLAQLRINFAVDPVVTRDEVITRTDSNVVRTGAIDESLPFLIAAGISGLLLLALALMGMRGRKGTKKNARKVMSLLLVGALLCASPAFTMVAHAADGDPVSGGDLTYTVRLYAGKQGTLREGIASVMYPDGGAVSCTQKLEGDVCVLEGVPYGARVTFDASELDDGGCVELNHTETADSKYYVRGVRESGQDNNTAELSPDFIVTGDADYVIAYGIRGNMVEYTIRFEDEAGNELAPAQTRHGNVGDRPIVAYQYIEGYRPQAYNLIMTLKDPAVDPDANNVFTFVYRPIDVNTIVQTVYAPGVTTVEPAPGVVPPAPAPGPAPEVIPEPETPLAETPEEVIDLDETPLAPGFFDPMTELLDEFATALSGLSLPVRLGLSAGIIGLGAWLILLFVRKQKDKKNAKAS